jgi:hypothetical protein
VTGRQGFIGKAVDLRKGTLDAERDLSLFEQARDCKFNPGQVSLRDLPYSGCRFGQGLNLRSNFV